MGMCSACAMTWPRVSKIAVEQSRRSLMLLEYDARMRAAPISSATVRSAEPMTSSVMRYTVRPFSSHCPSTGERDARR